MLRLHLIFPPDRHSWNLVEGWERMVRRLDWSVQVSKLGKSSAIDIAKNCRDGEPPDLVLAIGGDLHMAALHESAEIRKIWKKVNCPRVCLAYESLRDSLWPESRGKLESSLEVFTHTRYVTRSMNLGSQQWDDPLAGFPKGWMWIRSGRAGEPVSRVFFSEENSENMSNMRPAGSCWRSFSRKRPLICMTGS